MMTVVCCINRTAERFDVIQVLLNFSKLVISFNVINWIGHAPHIRQFLVNDSKGMVSLLNVEDWTCKTFQTGHFLVHLIKVVAVVNSSDRVVHLFESLNMLADLIVLVLSVYLVNGRTEVLQISEVLVDLCKIVRSFYCIDRTLQALEVGNL